MTITKDKALESARALSLKLAQKGHILAVFLWGSILNLKPEEPVFSDVDMLVLVDDLRLYYSRVKTKLFGVPVKSVKRQGVCFQYFFVDRAYIEEAINQGHWTVIDALRRRCVLIDHPQLNKLQSLAQGYHVFTTRTAKEWFNQSLVLIEKSRRIFELGDCAHSIVLARDAAQAAIYAFIYKSLGRPPSPSTFLGDLKSARGTDDLLTLFLDIHNLQAVERDHAVNIQLQLDELIRRILRMFDDYRGSKC